MILHGNMRRRCGYSVAELIVVSGIAATIAVVAFIPSASGDGAQVDAVSRSVAGMIDYARSAAIARPDRTYLLRVDVANNRFWLALATAPTTPITNPMTRQPFLTQLGPSSSQKLTSLRITGASLGGDSEVRFDSTGAMDQTEAVALELALGGKQFTLNVTPDSGEIKLLGGRLQAEAMELEK